MARRASAAVWVNISQDWLERGTPTLGARAASPARLIARQMTVDPNLIERARQVVSEWRSQCQRFDFLDAWEQLLDLDLDPASWGA